MWNSILRDVWFCLATNFTLIGCYYFLMKIMKSLTWTWDIMKACIAISFETPRGLSDSCPSILGPYIQTVKGRNMQLSPQCNVGVKNSDSFYGKVKSKISLSTPLWHIGGVGVWFHSFFTSAVGGGVKFTPRPLFPPGKNSRVHIEHGGWVWTFRRRGKSVSFHRGLLNRCSLTVPCVVWFNCVWAL